MTAAPVPALGGCALGDSFTFGSAAGAARGLQSRVAGSRCSVSRSQIRSCHGSAWYACHTSSVVSRTASSHPGACSPSHAHAARIAAAHMSVPRGISPDDKFDVFFLCIGCMHFLVLSCLPARATHPPRELRVGGGRVAGLGAPGLGEDARMPGDRCRPAPARATPPLLAGHRWQNERGGARRGHSRRRTARGGRASRGGARIFAAKKAKDAWDRKYTTAGSPLSHAVSMDPRPS